MILNCNAAPICYGSTTPRSGEKTELHGLSPGRRGTPTTPQVNPAAIHCPDCLIHHWEGVVLIPGVPTTCCASSKITIVTRNITARCCTLKDRVRDASTLDLRFRRQKVITVVLNIEHDVVSLAIPSRAHTQTATTSRKWKMPVNQTSEKPRESDNGFLWEWNVVAHGRKRPRRLRAERSSFAHTQHPCWTWLDDRAVCHRCAKGVSDVYARSNAKSGLGETWRE